MIKECKVNISELKELLKDIAPRTLDYSTEDRYLFEKIQNFLFDIYEEVKE